MLINEGTPHKLAIAWHDAVPVGLVAIGRFVSVSDPRPRKWHQFELKELFVVREKRNQGIGEALMDWVIAEAISQGVCRIDWHVKRDNIRGIKFYERFDGKIVENRLSMRKVLLD